MVSCQATKIGMVVLLNAERRMLNDMCASANANEIH